jgi:CheY-like chemotaxis protein
MSSPKVRAAILAVDDEPDTLAILQWSLASEEFEVMTASSGLEAVRHIQIILHTGEALPPTDPLYDRVITKPGDIDALLSEVHALLDLSRCGRPRAP